MLEQILRKALILVMATQACFLPYEIRLKTELDLKSRFSLKKYIPDFVLELND